MDENEEAALAGATMTTPPVPAPPPSRSLRRARWPLMILGVVIVAIGAVYVYLAGGRYESTDDAYVRASRTAISSNVPGRVIELAVHDNQPVHQGDLLYRIDDAPYRIAVEEAEAQLANSRLQIDALKANYRQRQADLSLAQQTVAFQDTEFQRQQRLQKSGISSQSQLDAAQHALDLARSRITAVQQESSAVVAQLGGNPNIEAARHPEVRKAQAALDRAKLNLGYTTVRAPADGVVTRVEELQVGAYVAASTPVFALVSTHDLWLEANFKEDQLTHMRVGQDATVEIDSYPGKKFHAKVTSLSPGTGSQFSVLPPENATGNWVKVVQRLPVRVTLTDADLDHPLQSGLSATVDVDTRFQRHLFSASGQVPASSVASNK